MWELPLCATSAFPVTVKIMQYCAGGATWRHSGFSQLCHLPGPHHSLLANGDARAGVADSVKQVSWGMITSTHHLLAGTQPPGHTYLQRMLGMQIGYMKMGKEEGVCIKFVVSILK